MFRVVEGLPGTAVARKPTGSIGECASYVRGRRSPPPPPVCSVSMSQTSRGPGAPLPALLRHPAALRGATGLPRTARRLPARPAAMVSSPTRAGGAAGAGGAARGRRSAPCASLSEGFFSPGRPARRPPRCLPRQHFRLLADAAGLPRRRSRCAPAHTCWPVGPAYPRSPRPPPRRHPARLRVFLLALRQISLRLPRVDRRRVGARARQGGGRIRPSRTRLRGPRTRLRVCCDIFLELHARRAASHPPGLSHPQVASASGTRARRVCILVGFCCLIHCVACIVSEELRGESCSEAGWPSRRLGTLAPRATCNCRCISLISLGGTSAPRGAELAPRSWPGGYLANRVFTRSAFLPTADLLLGGTRVVDFA